ncbi:beta-glucoside-specific PTS transporter subunit IIABC [Vagococcus intermedius]|uniref:PTS system sucrose-specific EIIBCA component n=1 Tax=Vagococcus intermedius TaxID=2991418 RepID=A0AAF0CW74_9ENTE|nr:beta-glucoside-specific PTS transporter subunit IIABC [Vagococcus intermedius]WEG74109.1 beta-glucoside-specific PTS transporter subunit IIABC [Vagococcus intermedius]WEG76189.1 beta-glucoside-specific PTS transporter subunit IIABC [Vagococcus intermedius]
MGKYSELAKEIVVQVGGKDNIRSLTHCITRLRFKLRDEAKANDDYLKNMEGVVTVMKSGGQYQVVIGNHVPQVYDEVLALTGLGVDQIEDDNDEEKQTLFNRLIDTISGCFQPFLGALAAAGMIKGLNALFLFLSLYTPESGTYLVLNAIGDAIFMFMPIMIGATSAKQFKVNQYVGMAIGAALCYPAIQKTTLSAGEAMGSFLGADYYSNFLGMPFIPNDYLSSVIPVIVIVWFASYVQKIAKRIVPEVIQTFFVPFFILLVSLPIGFLVIGPIITGLSNLLGSGFQSLYDFSPLLLAILVGFFWQVLVIFGLHWSLIPLALMNLGMYGYDTILTGTFGAGFAQTAVVMAMYFKFKNETDKKMCIPAIISGMCGITEPAIYGITLPRKKPFVFSMIGGAAGGAVMGVMGAKGYTSGGLGIFGVVNYINPETNDATGMYASFITIIVSMVIGFTLTYFFWKDDSVVQQPTEQVKNKASRQDIMSPLTGNFMPLSQIKDQAFSMGLLGKGVAILPTKGQVVAPFSGTVTTLFPTKHAIGLTSEDGMELLIHVGMDTVQLDGKFFRAHVEQGEAVKQGQLLLEFDIEKISQAGYSLETPIVITNTNDYLDIITSEESTIQSGEKILTGLV